MSDVEEIKQRLDIVELISGYLPLQKAGRNFKAVCPFHAEKTPSFYVFPERQTWHCFGACGTGGDVFSFVMKKESLEFGDTLRLLAQKAGIVLKGTEERSEKKEERKRLTEINKMAASYYHELLLNSPEAEVARKYLLHRELSQQVVQDFQLGFSSTRPDALFKYLVELGCREEELLAAGLVMDREHGGRIDRFHHRLMFPIRDARGEVLGFGARALDDSFPKYINSPQTSVFDKGKILYALDRAKEAIRKQDQVVIVEGYMDVITAHQHGFNNAVASMGTAITEAQVSNLKKLTRNIAFALDADTAGQAATQRGIATAAAALDDKVVPVLTPRGAVRFENVLDAEIKVIELSHGKDPDEIIRRNGQEWRALVDNALPVIDYSFRRVASSLDLSKPNDKSEAVKQLQPVIDDIKDPVRRAHYVQKLAHLVGLEEDVVADALRSYGGGAKSKTKSKRQAVSAASPLSGGDSREEYSLALLLRYPELHRHAGKFSSDYFQRVDNKQLFLSWERNPDAEVLQEELDDSLKEHLSMLRARLLPPMTPEVAEQALEDCVCSLRERWLMGLKAKEKIMLLSEAEAEPSSDGAEMTQQLQQTALEVNAQLREVFELKKKRAKPGNTA